VGLPCLGSTAHPSHLHPLSRHHTPTPPFHGSPILCITRTPTALLLHCASPANNGSLLWLCTLTIPNAFHPPPPVSSLPCSTCHGCHCPLPYRYAPFGRGGCMRRCHHATCTFQSVRHVAKRCSIRRYLKPVWRQRWPDATNHLPLWTADAACRILMTDVRTGYADTTTTPGAGGTGTST